MLTSCKTRMIAWLCPVVVAIVSNRRHRRALDVAGYMGRGSRSESGCTRGRAVRDRRGLRALRGCDRR